MVSDKMYDRPLCSCGCGNKVKLGQRGKYNKFLHGHNGHVKKIHYEKFEEPPECECGCGLKVEWSESRKRWRRTLRGHSTYRRVSKLQFQDSPICQCGCGEQVKWSKQNNSWNLFVKGHNNTGITFSEEHRKKISQGEMGKSISAKTREILSKALTGRKLSEETKRKMRERKPSEEQKLKQKEWWLNFKESDKYEDYIKRVMKRRIPTSLEEKFIKIINKNNLPFEFVGDGSFIIAKKNPDFINKEKKIIVEVYCRFYKNKNFGDIEKWKEERERVFFEYGWTTIFFDETEVNEKHVVKRLS